MRPTKLVVGAVLTTALALVALPGLSASRTPGSPPLVDVAALQTVSSPARALQAIRIEPLDPVGRSAGFVAPHDPFIEPGKAVSSVPSRPAVAAPRSRSSSVERPPRYTLTGIATFYDHGTTAMRLPRGTLVVICGGGGCVERTITDYGPNAARYPERIVDLYRPDFFRICGCPSWSGTTSVTVRVY